MAFFSPLPYQMAVFTNRGLAGGRLSLSATDPAPATDILAATELYYLAYASAQIGLWADIGNGPAWNVLDFQTAGLDLSAMAAKEIDDVFAYWAGGGLHLERSAWRGFGQAIEGVSHAAPAVVTATAHGLKSGDIAYVNGAVGSVTINDKAWTVNVLTANTFELVGSDTSADGAWSADGWFTARKLLPPIGQAISGATNPAGPALAVITSAAHGLTTGEIITIAGVKGNTAVNVSNTAVTVIDANTFTVGVVGNGAYTALTGYWKRSGSSLPASANGLKDGIEVKPGDPTRRLLGIVIADGTGGESEDSAANRLVSNLYNAVPRDLHKADATGHDYASTTVRAWNGAATNAVKLAIVVPQVVDVDVSGSIVSKKAGSVAKLAVGLDRADGVDGGTLGTQGVDVLLLGAAAHLPITVQGAHTVTAVEVSTADGGTYAEYALDGTVVN